LKRLASSISDPIKNWVGGLTKPIVKPVENSSINVIDKAKTSAVDVLHPLANKLSDAIQNIHVQTSNNILVEIKKLAEFCEALESLKKMRLNVDLSEEMIASIDKVLAEGKDIV
jgi:hypothetical protein